MALSSNSILHFTNKESLVWTLNNNFGIKYCLEEICTTKKSLRLAVPMVSFCDIPLSQINKHIESYGGYGIGLRKEWAQRKGLNPVIYMEKDSALNNIYRTFYNKSLAGKMLEELNDMEKPIIELLRYMKNYQGDLVRKNNPPLKDYRFSDEREWRYVPSFDSPFPPILPFELYNTDAVKAEQNKKLYDFKLEFEPNDISYLIINDETERSEFIQILNDAKGDKYSKRDVERLMSRILTSELIKTDF